jgi:predicted dehydrogenase
VTTARKPLRVGVAGAGVFGRNHASKLASNPDAVLAGIYDVHAERAAALGAEFGVLGFDELEALLLTSDALVVATPAVFHSAITRAAIAAGKHCLIEKPLAATHAEALELCALAETAGVVLQAGHQERYVFQAMGLLPVTRRPIKIEGVRAGPPSPRGSDVSATLDLMVHDLDLVTLLMGELPVTITAQLLSGPPETPDAVSALLDYSHGTVHLVASRASATRERRMRLEYDTGVVDIDFMAKQFSDTACLDLHADFATRIADPMGAATADFLAAIRGERAVAIPARDGATAVGLAEAIDRACAR